MPTFNIPDSAKSFFKRNRNLIIAGALALLLIAGVIMAFTSWLGNWFDWQYINKTNSNINAVMVDANKINANLANLAIEEKKAAEEANARLDTYNKAKEKTDEAKREADQALDNLNAIRSRDFNGTSAVDAKRAYCAANPDDPGCGN